MANRSLQASFHFAQLFEHLNTRQAKGWTPFERQQVAHTPQEVLHDRFLFGAHGVGEDWGA